MTYQSLQSTISSDVPQAVSLNDYEEAQRYMETYGAAVGYGEGVYDDPDATDALRAFGPRG